MSEEKIALTKPTSRDSGSSGLLPADIRPTLQCVLGFSKGTPHSPVTNLELYGRVTDGRSGLRSQNSTFLGLGTVSGSSHLASPDVRSTSPDPFHHNGIW